MTSCLGAGLRLALHGAWSVELYEVGWRKDVDNGDLPAVVSLPEIVGACRYLHDSALLGLSLVYEGDQGDAVPDHLHLQPFQDLLGDPTRSPAVPDFLHERFGL